MKMRTWTGIIMRLFHYMYSWSRTQHCWLSFSRSWLASLTVLGSYKPLNDVSNWNNIQAYINSDLGMFYGIYFHCSWNKTGKTPVCFPHQIAELRTGNNLKSICKFIHLIFGKFVNSVEKALNTRLVMVFPYTSIHVVYSTGRNGSLG